MSEKISSLDIEGKVGGFELPISLLFYIKKEETREKIVHFLTDKYQVLSSDEIRLVSNQDKSKKKLITIEEMRVFIRAITLTPIGPIRFGIINNSDEMTREAANALLKTLEEPPRRALIALFSKTRRIIATVRSRCREVEISEGIEKQKIDQELKTVLYKPFYEQSRYIDGLIKRDGQHEALAQLLLLAEERIREDKDLNSVKIAREIIKTQGFIADNTNTKLALENLMLKLSE